eukprot:CAMPEP_0113848490 /NCGR_PEP_ID=MMETSP0372-20130328/2512_1 /TAXON_ID=340204 /ORGANISM="Lankesteria abbotti" /LENGTH=298 /DNA_ID=CAMNT_0000817991 /DNA_START=46 /DNA_END=942 /DNA_ORIENTATION=- /assembly_acc=CAM_ASM_000359
MVDSGHVHGWDDPRFPTVQGIIRRGLQVPALMEFILDQGPSKNANLMEWGALWNKNKQLIDPIAPRYMAVARDGAVVVHLKGAPTEPEKRERALHQKNESLGMACQYFCCDVLIEQDDAAARKDGEEVTLMKWGNAFFDELVWSEDRKQVVEINATLNVEGNVKNTNAKLHWVPLMEDKHQLDTNSGDVSERKLSRCVLREFDHLITKKKPEETDEITDIINTNSLFDTAALTDPLLRQLNLGTVIQLERRGFFRVDRPWHSQHPHQDIVLVKIPDGKTKAMSTLSTKVDAAKLSKGQ